jgi:hypothetical protein
MAEHRHFAVATFPGVDPRGQQLELSWEEFAELVLARQVIGRKDGVRGFSPTRYLERYVVPPAESRPHRIAVATPKVYRCNEGVEALSMLVVDVDHAVPDRRHLYDLGCLVLGYTTCAM